MKIILDEQDVMDSVHVYIAVQGNRGVVEGSEPHNVNNVELFHDVQNGFSAKGYTNRTPYHLDQQDFIDAMALYMSPYYSFASNRLMINLAWDEATDWPKCFITSLTPNLTPTRDGAKLVLNW